MELNAIGNVAATNVQRSVDNVQVSSTASTPTTQSTKVQTANAVQQAATPPSMEQLKQAVDEANIASQSFGIQFSIDQDSKDTIVKVVDKQTKEVVRQIPSEQMLEIAKSIDQTIGKLLQQKSLIKLGVAINGRFRGK